LWKKQLSQAEKTSFLKKKMKKKAVFFYLLFTIDGFFV